MRKVAERGDNAVSPVIGTVLLIAITVTLVASVYTIVGSYFNGLPSPSPTVSLKVVNSTAESGSLINGSYTLSVTYISNNVSTGNVQIQVAMNNSQLYEFMLSSVVQAPGGTYTIFNGTSGNITAKYSGATGFLTSSSVITIGEANNTAYINRISIIDASTDSSMGSLVIFS